MELLVAVDDLLASEPMQVVELLVAVQDLLASEPRQVVDLVVVVEQLDLLDDVEFSPTLLVSLPKVAARC